MSNRTTVLIYSLGDTPITRVLQDVPQLELQSVDKVPHSDLPIWRCEARGVIKDVSQQIYIQIDGNVVDALEGDVYHYLDAIEKDCGIQIETTTPTDGKFFKLTQDYQKVAEVV